MKEYILDGQNFTSLEEFYEEVSNVLIPGIDYWGRNLDAFDDILFGGFGTLDDGFIIIWRNSNLSRERLGYEETVRQLQKRSQRCHSSNVPYVIEELEVARRKQGRTVFDWLIDIMQGHKHIELRLE